MSCVYIWPHVSGNFGQIALVILTCVAMTISIPGNILTGFIVIRNETLRNEPAYLLICSVCLADIIVSTITQPFFIATMLLGTRKSCNLDNTYFSFAWVSSVSSALGVITITFDRYLYIVHPLHYRTYMTQRRAIMMITVVWAIAIMFGTLPLLWHNSLVLHTITLVVLVVISVFMAYTYGRVYIKLRTTKEPPTLNTASKKRKLKSQNQATRTVLLVVLAFFGCWYPWSIISFVIALHDAMPGLQSYAVNSYVLKLHWISLTFGYFNSALNVFIYSRKNTVLRSAIAKYLRCNSVRAESNLAEHKSPKKDDTTKPRAASAFSIFLKDEKTKQPNRKDKRDIVMINDIHCATQIVEFTSRMAKSQINQMPAINLRKKETYIWPTKMTTYNFNHKRRSETMITVLSLS
ncbi:adrenocorticotropic hormone receptor-like [Hydractinia symbiolongicarpus]|uniref:adrenocorticotropic hormone receptor-like n=1 Tax=Hydractinia symbiolongicarpus TaxID=13093 RepID=UPI00254E3CF7|nr:adrenocorticotropic hormone receptor-like [Hydractinia symbiolongicarpus]XP_057294123.1 adrenocorticotropic hormone receptor-like [Hydractinia symbiolongicarpus]XP_057294124.1 adrenocorticotropic hormone receptor-like [Hydractinia symbiolongicarpus]